MNGSILADNQSYEKATIEYQIMLQESYKIIKQEKLKDKQFQLALLCLTHARFGIPTTTPDVNNFLF
jgi:hypothetical protein